MYKKFPLLELYAVVQFASAKSPNLKQTEKISHHQSLISNYPTISHTGHLYLPSR